MKGMYNLCPDCVEPLVKDKKKLGGKVSDWLICNGCGYREVANPHVNELQVFEGGLFKRDKKELFDEEN